MIGFEEFKKECEERNFFEVIKEHISRKYCPIVEKIMIMNTMLKKSVSNTVHNMKYVDHTLLTINFSIGLIIMYTDLRLSDEDGLMDVYDWFASNNGFSLILDNVNLVEKSELKMVKDNVVKVFTEVENAPREYVSSLYDDLKIFVQGFLPNEERLAELLNMEGLINE